MKAIHHIKRKKSHYIHYTNWYIFQVEFLRNIEGSMPVFPGIKRSSKL